MGSQLVTFTQIADKIRIAGDWQNSSLRVDDSDIRTLVVDALGRYIGQGSGIGWPYWLTPKEGTTTVGPEMGELYALPFGVIQPEFEASSEGAMGIEGVYRVEIRSPGGAWFALEPVQFNFANAAQDDLGSTQNGVPRRYFAVGGTTLSQLSSAAVSTIGISPPADQEYPYRVWYATVPKIDDVDDPIDMGVPGGEWWIVWDVVSKLKIRDHYPDEAQLALLEREKSWQELVQRVNSRNKNASFRVRDTESRRRTLGRRWLGMP